MAHRRHNNARRTRSEARISSGQATLDDARRFQGNWLWIGSDLRAKLEFDRNCWLLVFRSSLTGLEVARRCFETGGYRGVQGYWWPGNTSLLELVTLPDKVPPSRYYGPLW